jgi:hypothetical protein
MAAPSLSGQGRDRLGLRSAIDQTIADVCCSCGAYLFTEFGSYARSSPDNVNVINAVRHRVGTIFAGSSFQVRIVAPSSDAFG